MGWTDVNAAQFAQRTEQEATRRTGGDFADMLKMKAGATGKPNVYKLRLLPPHENMGGDPFVEVDMHFNLGPDGKGTTVCRAFFGKPCKGCDEVKDWGDRSENNDDAKEVAALKKRIKDSKRKLRVTGNFIDMEHPEKGPVRWAFPPDVKKQIRAAFFDKETREYRNISHPQTGRNLIVEVEMNAGGFWDYTVTASERESLLADMDWLDKIDDLTQAVKEPTEAEVLAAVTGKKVDAAASTTTAREASTPAVDTTKDVAVTKPAAKPMPPPATPKGATAAEKKAEKKTTEAAAPPPAATPPPAAVAAKPKREPISTEPEAAVDADLYATGRAACVAAGFATPAEITPDELAARKKFPNCFTKEPDPTDTMCQGCAVLLPCITAKLAAA